MLVWSIKHVVVITKEFTFSLSGRQLDDIFGGGNTVAHENVYTVFTRLLTALDCKPPLIVSRLCLLDARNGVKKFMQVALACKPHLNIVTKPLRYFRNLARFAFNWQSW